MLRPRVYFADDSYCIGFWNNITLVDTSAEINVARMRQLFTAYRELLAQFPRIAVLCVLRAGTPLSSSDARNEAAKLEREYGESIIRVSFVLEEAGVVVQLFGSLVRTFNQISRNSKLSVDTSLDNAARGLAPLVQPSGERQRVGSELKDAFLDLRGRWTPRARD